jgi:hypothetical protein
MWPPQNIPAKQEAKKYLNISTSYLHLKFNLINFVFFLKPIVQWKMKAPEKKPLVITAKPADVSARVRKASQKKRVEPIKELSEFQA